VDSDSRNQIADIDTSVHCSATLACILTPSPVIYGELLHVLSNQNLHIIVFYDSSFDARIVLRDSYQSWGGGQDTVYT
jgi:hypothetical protein